MESLNNALFLWLNAPAHPNGVVLAAAIAIAQYFIWIIPGFIGISWLRGNPDTRRLVFVATTSGLIGLLINQGIALFWWHPRPFMIPIGHTFVVHAPDSSFPSDHLTLWWAVAFCVLAQGRRHLGVLLALLGLPLAWARIYVGVHFPLDMVGAAMVAVTSTWVCVRTEKWYLPLLFPLTMKIHRRLFSKLIAIGLIRD